MNNITVYFMDGTKEEGTDEAWQDGPSGMTEKTGNDYRFYPWHQIKMVYIEVVDDK